MVRLHLGIALLLLPTPSGGQISAGGTLVTVVPANGGIIVVADSRTHVRGRDCDNQNKLSVPKLRKNTAVFQTGNGRIFNSFERVKPAEICRYIKSTPPVIDVGRFLVEQVDAKPNQLLTQTELHDIEKHCLSMMTNSARKFSLINFRGKGMFRAVIVSYDAKHESELLGTFEINLDSSGVPLLGEEQWYEFSKTDKISAVVRYFGETDFVKQHVLGKQFLEPFGGVMNKTVQETSLAEASSAAVSFMTAAEEAAKSQEQPPIIGGPIDVVTITKKGAVLKHLRK
jgi:hypothetical protein